MRCAAPSDPFPLHQRKQLFRNLGDGRFEDVTARAGAVFERSEVGRGAAFGDIDNDGDTDVVVGNNNGPAQVLMNTTGTRNHWIGSAGRDAGARATRDMLGARVAVIREGQPTSGRRAPRRRQLRVGQRSARARRAGHVGGRAASR